MARLELATSEAASMALAVGIPGQAQAVQLLAAAAALLGDRIAFERAGIRQPADLRLTVVTRNTTMPKWLEVYWKALLETGKATPVPRDPFEPTPARRTQIRRNLGVLESIGLGHTAEATHLRYFLSMKSSGNLMLPNTIGLPDARRWSNGTTPPTGLVVFGARRVLRVLQGDYPPLALSAMSRCDWASTARALGAGGIGGLGWILELPEPGEPPNAALWTATALGFVDRLEKLRLDTAVDQRIYVAGGMETTVLEECERDIAAMAESLPACLRDEAQVDRLLGWRLTAVLCALYLDGSRPWEVQARRLFALWATRLARWLAARHIRMVRNAFPCDADGHFTDGEHAVFRQLGDACATIRQIQRGLKGCSAADCLKALQRAVSAGLALEEPVGRWRLAPTLRMSESAQHQGPEHSAGGDSETSAAAFADNSRGNRPGSSILSQSQAK
jgi:hypothetical protein